MENFGTSRKRRLEEALEYCAVAQKLHHGMQQAENDDADITYVPYNNSQKRRKPSLRETLELKISVLEKWESTKRRALERLTQDIDNLLQKESEIGKLETLRATELDKRRSMSAISYSSDFDQPLDMTTPKSCHRRLSQPVRATTPTTHRTLAKGRKSLEARKPLQIKVFQEIDDMVVIGPHGTQIPRNALHSINWSLSGPAITRKILMEVFDRDTLAFHTLTGKPSPAFMDCDKPLKHRLDPKKVADIVHIITENLGMTPKEVRSAITTKCADENKMFRQREKKRLSVLEMNRNNNNVTINNFNKRKYSDSNFSDNENKENSL